MNNYKTPFPANLKGRFAEIEEAKQTRFFEIDYIKYDRENLQRPINIDCLGDSMLGNYISLLEENDIDLDTQYLYKLQTYLGDKNFSNDMWEFNKRIFDYKQITFTCFDKLLEYCMSNFGISMSNFLPKGQTNLP